MQPFQTAFIVCWVKPYIINSTKLYRVIKIISEQLELDPNKELTESTSVVDDLGADSLEVIELIMKMEEEFGVEMPEEETTKLKTVGDIVKAIEEKLA